MSIGLAVANTITAKARKFLLPRLWENFTMSDGRELKGFVIPPWVAAVMLTAFISAVGFLYSQNQTQRELLIRVDQRLEDKTLHDNQEFLKMNGRFDSVEAWQSVTNKEIVRLQEQNGRTRRN